MLSFQYSKAIEIFVIIALIIFILTTVANYLTESHYILIRNSTYANVCYLGTIGALHCKGNFTTNLQNCGKVFNCTAINKTQYELYNFSQAQKI